MKKIFTKEIFELHLLKNRRCKRQCSGLPKTLTSTRERQSPVFPGHAKESPFPRRTKNTTTEHGSRPPPRNRMEKMSQ